MSRQEMTGSTAIVTGASRGVGRAVATALAHSGASVVGVARDERRLDDVRAELGESFIPVVADAADPVVAGQLIDAYGPRTVVLNAGARSLARPIHNHTWESFSRHWNVDVKQVFHWTREALLRPLAPGSTVVAFSSGAALAGSPLSGGYAGAKATVRFVSTYAAAESERAELGIRFTAVLPQLMPETELGGSALAAYAARDGIDAATALERMGAVLTAEQVGKFVVDLVADPTLDGTAYLLTAAGLNPLS